MFTKYKWHLLGVILAGLLLFVALVGHRIKSADKLTEWVIKKRSKVLKEAVEKRKSEAESVDEEIESIDKRIEEIDKERDIVDEESQRATVKELSDMWNEIGY